MKLTLPENLIVSDADVKSILEQIEGDVLSLILNELKIMNRHLSILTDEEIVEGDI